MPTKKTKKTTKKPAKKAASKKPTAKKAAKKAAKKPVAKKAAKKVAKKAAKKPVAKKAAKKASKKASKKAPTKAAAKKTAKKATKKVATKKVAKKASKKVANKAAAKKTTKTTKKATKKPVAKKAAKKASKKVAKKAVVKKVATKAEVKASLTPRIDLATSVVTASSAKGHGAISLPGRTIKSAPLFVAPTSGAARATLIPDADDALDDAMGDAFDAVFVKPKPRVKSTEPFVPGDPQEDLAQICAALALDRKADDVVILNVAALTSYADFFVIAGTSSERQAQGVARTISDELRQRGRQTLTTDGMEQGNWVVLDYGAVVVHVFMATARAYYDLDGFWSDAPRVDVDESRGLAALDAMASAA